MYVLINAAAGTPGGRAMTASGVEAEFARLGVSAKAEQVEPADLTAAVQRALASDAEVIVAAGGDGTINTIAAQMLDRGRVLGILPFGTMNQLAKELGFPSEPSAAIAALARGRAVDYIVGEVNGRAFLSFSAMGLYSDIIKHRDAQRKALGRGKWWAMLVSVFRILGRFPLFFITIKIGEQKTRRYTPLVFVTLSEYQRRIFGVDKLACSDRSVFSIYIGKSLRRWGVVRSILRALLRVPDPQRDLDVECASEMQIITRQPNVRVAIDGEVIDLPSPLTFRIRKGTLRMFVPHTERMAQTTLSPDVASV